MDQKKKRLLRQEHQIKYIESAKAKYSCSRKRQHEKNEYNDTAVRKKTNILDAECQKRVVRE